MTQALSQVVDALHGLDGRHSSATDGTAHSNADRVDEEAAATDLGVTTTGSCGHHGPPIGDAGQGEGASGGSRAATELEHAPALTSAVGDGATDPAPAAIKRMPRPPAQPKNHARRAPPGACPRLHLDTQSRPAHRQRADPRSMQNTAHTTHCAPGRLVSNHGMWSVAADNLVKHDVQCRAPVAPLRSRVCRC
jgi:hypothetical protein